MSGPVKVTDFDTASTLVGTEVVPGYQASAASNSYGGTVKILISQIGTYVRGLFTTTPATIAEGGTGAATAAAARTALDVQQDVFTTRGDMVRAGVSGVAERFALGASGAIVTSNGTDAAWDTPYATVAAHATTMDPWANRVSLLTGSAVTVTGIADADYVGQRILLIMNAAHIWTQGAVFDVQGGATYTTAAGDWVELVATTVSTFDVMISPVAGTPLVVATQAEQETGTSTTKPVTPGRQQYHPSSPKCWARWNSAGTIATSYNMTSITDSGSGDWTATIATDFSGATWTPVVSSGHVTATAGLMCNVQAVAAGTCNVITLNAAFSLTDPTGIDGIMLVGFGDQA